MSINPRIFREYDVRGIIDRDLTEDVAERVGRAFASELRARTDGVESGSGTTNGGARLTVAVGRDNRPSSPALARAISDGIRGAGVDVIDVGTVPTPLLYYATERFGTNGGLQVTGSHNPPEYNGFKMLAGGRALYGDAIQQLRQRIDAERFETGGGALEEQPVIPLYIDDLAGRFQLARPLKAVVDCGNGAGSLVAAELLRRIGLDVVTLYCESDGTFPNHHPDPTVDENLRDLIARVQAEHADVGVALDGDADRIGAVDENGRIIRGDILLLLFGLDALERLGAPQTLVFDVKCSQVVPEVYAARGGVPVMWKTGHSLIKEKMKETHAPIAGELSGHICFGEDYYGFDDALYAACYLAQLLARGPVPLSERVDAFPTYVSTPEIRVDVDEDSKFDIVRRAVEHFQRDHEVVAVDGARVQFPDGWGLLRASNTQPVLVLRYEASTKDALGHIRETMEGWLHSQGIGSGDDNA
ncbi:MAG: phosphomannomutase/phosphoglucomutase [Longimicrobiales bacterium]